MAGEDENAVELLREALGWRLSVDDWGRVDTAVKELAEGQHQGPVGIRHVVALELLTPSRIRTRVGDKPAVEIPPDVRDRINELVGRIVVKSDSPVQAEARR